MPEPEKLRRFLVRADCRVGNVVTLEPEQSHHLTTVLRIRAGDLVRLFTGRGQEVIGRVEVADAAAAQVRIMERCAQSGRPQRRLALGFAPPPAQRADFLIEKATELGVSSLHPLICERLQGFRGATAGRRTERWQRKAEDAARQSERTTVPEVRAPIPLEDFLAEAWEGLLLIGHTGEARPLWQVLSEADPEPASACAVVGPSGGFTRREVEMAQRAGFLPVSIAPHVLRVETAAVCLLAAVVVWLDGSCAAG